MIPQFETTYYLEVFYRVYSTTLSSQTFSVGSVERFHFFQVLASGLWAERIETLMKNDVQLIIRTVGKSVK